MSKGKKLLCQPQSQERIKSPGRLSGEVTDGWMTQDVEKRKKRKDRDTGRKASSAWLRLCQDQDRLPDRGSSLPEGWVSVLACI